MIQKNLAFGIIGCGTISTWHAKAILKIEGAKLAGVTDINKDAREAFAQEFGTKAYDSLEDMLLNKEIDVVCICTPSGLHESIAIKAAGARKHIITEKPMAVTTEGADRMIEVCKENQVKMAVISQLRFTDAVEKLKDAVERGMLGRLVSGDIYMKFYRSQEYYDQGGWRGTWKMDGGGALMNQGIHGIDLLQYVMGPVKSVFAHVRTLARNIEVEDTATAILEFKNGALGVIQGTTSIYPGSARRLEINGDRGTIVLEEDSILSWDIQGQESSQEMTGERTKSGAASNPTAFGLEGHVKQIQDMVDAIRHNQKPLVDQYEGKKPIQIIRAVYESSRTGKMVYL